MSANLGDENAQPLASSEPAEGLTVAEFQSRLAAAAEPDRDVELIDGVVIRRSRRTLRHDGGMERVVAALSTLLPNGWRLRTDCPLVTADCQPQPDVVIVPTTLQEDLPWVPAGGVPLVVEVADISLQFDRQSKGRVYARAAIARYWILNLIDRQLEVYWNPSGPAQMPGYQEGRVYRGDERVDVVIGMDDLGTIRVDDILP